MTTPSRNFTAVEPPGEIVALADVKAYLNVAHDDDDELIERLIAAAVGSLDGPEGAIGRCLGEQSWRLALDCFPSAAIRIALPPLVSVDSLKYIDRDGIEQTLAPTAYHVSGIGRTGIVTPIAPWPATRQLPESVLIEFTAGYETVPAQLIQAIMALVYFWYEQRPTASDGEGLITQVPFGFNEVVWDWKSPDVY